MKVETAMSPDCHESLAEPWRRNKPAPEMAPSTKLTWLEALKVTPAGTTTLPPLMLMLGNVTSAKKGI